MDVALHTIILLINQGSITSILKLNLEKMDEITFTKLESWFLTSLQEEFENLEKDEWADYVNDKKGESLKNTDGTPAYTLPIYFDETIYNKCDEYLERYNNGNMLISLRYAILDSIDWKKIVKYHARDIKDIIDDYKEYANLSAILEKYYY